MPIASPSKSVRPVIWALFGLKGRISRHVYWLSYLLVTCLQSALGAQILEAQLLASEEAGLDGLTAAGVGQVLLAISLYSTFAVSVKRLHDVGYADALALAVIIPFVNFAFAVWLGLVPGNAHPNQYGDAPDVPV